MDAELDLCLYVVGDTQLGRNAQDNVHRICRANVGDRYRLEVVDLREHPEEAERLRLFATPMLMKRNPPPPQRLIGDMSETGRVMLALGMRSTA